MRTDDWLNQRLELIWARFFADIPVSTPVDIHFGRRSYQRLGSIALRKIIRQGVAEQRSRITISSLLAEELFPDIIVDQIIAHELVHYVHGFGSLRPRTLRHPHQGGVIIKEFQKRGLWELYRAYQAWMKIHYKRIVTSYQTK
jgi:hypothetical protein